MSPLPVSIPDSAPSTHLVHFYSLDHRPLIENVSAYLGEGLRNGEGVVMVATRGHFHSFMECLEQQGYNPAEAERGGRLVFRDAEETLARFMVDGVPDAGLFERAIGPEIRWLRANTGIHAVRAYGEMVSLLWNSGATLAAVQLEKLWNKRLLESGLQLFCSYQIDIFGKEFQPGVVDELMCAHTHVVPARANQDLENAVAQAMDEVLGARAKDLRRSIPRDTRPSWAVTPEGENTVLWIRNNLPEYADEILSRARNYFRPATAFSSHQAA